MNDENVHYLANQPEKLIHNEDADFFTCRNYILQLVAENQITPDAVVVYCFYRSFAGLNRQQGGPETLAFDFSFELICDNTGVSRKSIQRSLKLLRDAGVISYQRKGLRHHVVLVPNEKLPKRHLYKIDEDVPNFNATKKYRGKGGD